MLRGYGIIAAGGSGKRMGADVPKQLLELDGISIFERSLRPFIRCPEIEGIVIVAEADIFEHINEVVDGISDNTKSISVVKGGVERQDSVRNGLEAVPEDVDVVVIHDAVRPFITAGLISECVRSAFDNGAVCVMRPLKETLKVVSDSIVRETLDRSKLWIAQTPQAFGRKLLLKAHQNAVAKNITGTDDSMLVELLGKPVHVIEGSDMNIKITTPVDLKIAAAVLAMFTKLED
ncbi:2-C-methyl-D-erythritol 4-phosphate cytidylyltransferase [Candidatus Latescibacterota bacterium]